METERTEQADAIFNASAPVNRIMPEPPIDLAADMLKTMNLMVNIGRVAHGLPAIENFKGNEKGEKI